MLKFVIKPISFAHFPLAYRAVIKRFFLAMVFRVGLLFDTLKYIVIELLAQKWIFIIFAHGFMSDEFCKHKTRHWEGLRPYGSFPPQRRTRPNDGFSMSYDFRPCHQPELMV